MKSVEKFLFLFVGSLALILSLAVSSPAQPALRSTGDGAMIRTGNSDMADALAPAATTSRRGDSFSVNVNHNGALLLLDVVVSDFYPQSGGLLGGFCGYDNNPEVTRTLWMRFAAGVSDSVTAVAFDWKRTADPDAPAFWQVIGQAVFDDSSSRWAYAWNDTSLACGLITLRARVHSNAVPLPQDTTINFADSVRMDNCEPIVAITNINGNPAPNNMNIGRGQIETITATVTDSFGNGANSTIDSVAFYYSRVSLVLNVPSDWVYIGSDSNGVPWQTIWDTGALTPGVFQIHAVAWDHAGNCGQGAIPVNLVDQYPQRAWIVGMNADSVLGCTDRIWAVTEDGQTNRTTRVSFDYSVNNAQTWIHLGETGANTPFCGASSLINIWSWPLEFDSIPSNAIFRAVATDNNNNYDPAPPRFMRADLDTSATPAVFDEEWARAHVTPGPVHWMFGLLKGPEPTCFANAGLICANPVPGDSTEYEGKVDSVNTRPCILTATNGILTVFSASPIQRDTAQYMVLTAHNLAIHSITANGGSGGALTSEDRQVELTVPHNGSGADGTLWFEPAQDTANAVPPTQPTLSLLSMIEAVMSKTMSTGTAASGFRVYFNATALPANDTMVVAAYWDQTALMWLPTGINVTTRHIDRTHADSSYVQFSLLPNWRASSEHAGCPNKLRVAVFHSSARPLADRVHFSSATCSGIPDSTYYGLDTNGVRTDCRPTLWVHLNEGGARDANTVTVFLDSIRIVQNGVPQTNAFDVRLDTLSETFSVFFAPRADTVAPWFGCLAAGRHTAQFFSDGQRTVVTPFYADVSGPTAHSTPGYITHTATITADLTDLESGVDTTTAEAMLRNCANPGDLRFVRVGADAMTYTPLSNGHGYHTTFTVPWEQVQVLFPDTVPRPADQLCVEWHVKNKVCLANDSTTYLYTIDVQAPLTMPLSPIGAGGQIDTLNFGERPVIEALVVDSARNGSGASGLNLGALQLNIDEHVFTLADTGSTALNFHIIAPNAYNADIRFGGQAAEPIVSPYYAPGSHRVTLIVPDSLGNLGAQPYAWSYYVRAGGPLVTFDTTTTTCGVWFNPSHADSFQFCVDSAQGVPLAPSGIQYSAFTVPDHQRISGPTIVNPQSTAHQCVWVDLSAAFPLGETGVEIVVDGWNTLYVPDIDSLNGITHSRLTYWADNFPPLFTGHVPASDSLLSRNNPIDVSVTYTDQSPDTARARRSSRNTFARGRHGRTLDDNGSGIVPQTVRMTIFPPSGAPIFIAPDSATHFTELDAAHARFVLPAGQAAGNYLVTAHVEDCVGNVSDTSWTFRVGGLAPTITFLSVPAGTPCEVQGYWNPDYPLHSRATVQERDSANVDPAGLKVDILRLYACGAGICTDTLLRDITPTIIGEQPNPTILNQTFTLQDSFQLNPGANATEIHIVLTATNSVGVGGSQTQVWIVDGVPPQITPVSPEQDAVLLPDEPVTISANYGDADSDTLTVANAGRRAGGKAGNPVAKRGQQPQVRGRAGRSVDEETQRGPSAALRSVTPSKADALDGSGVDTVCVTLHLRSHSDGSERDLTAESQRSTGNITWTNTLAVGSYTATVSACDRVCNTNTVSWDFTVGPHVVVNDSIPPTITLISPPETPALPLHSSPTFRVQFTDAPGGEMDSASIHLKLTTINSDSIPGTLSITMAENRLSAVAALAVDNLAAGRYELLAEGADVSGNRSSAGFSYTVVDTTTNPPGGQLGDSAVYNYPNPFSSLPNEGGGMTHFSLPASGGTFVQIKIYDFSGLFVRTVFDGNLPFTGYEPAWRGENENGVEVAGGVYLARVQMRAGDQSRQQVLKVAYKRK
jgi:hypothetical protein